MYPVTGIISEGDNSGCLDGNKKDGGAVAPPSSNKWLNNFYRTTFTFSMAEPAVVLIFTMYMPLIMDWRGIENSFS